ncbi:FHA domain-containing protein [Solemya velesiana gill symbiont]|nr:FHA domain-containing protein [Solemya velesiana gill symbiont]
MEELVVYKDDVVVTEIDLDKPEILIGRGVECDVHLDDLSVSRHHGQLRKIFTDFFIEDLGSTNGTLLNEKPIKKHILKNGDVLTLGAFRLRYVREGAVEEEEDLDKTVVLEVPKQGAASKAQPARSLTPKTAAVKFFRGANKGHSDEIKRPLYTIGKPGGDVAAIARRPQGFYLLHIGGDHYPKINDKEIDVSGGVQLHEGDLVEVGENLAEISFG